MWFQQLGPGLYDESLSLHTGHARTLELALGLEVDDPRVQRLLRGVAVRDEVAQPALVVELVPLLTLALVVFRPTREAPA